MARICCGRSAILFLLTAASYSVGQFSGRQPQVIVPAGDSEFVHDPSIIKDGNTWYLFSTAAGPVREGELPIRCSPDLKEWKKCGNVFPNVPEWIKKLNPTTKELWAPD